MLALALTVGLAHGRSLKQASVRGVCRLSLHRLRDGLPAALQRFFRGSGPSVPAPTPLRP